MAEYLFVLGRANELCRAELEAVLAREKISCKIIFSSPEILHLSTSGPPDVNFLIQTLGGTIKIGEVVGRVEEKEEEKLINTLSALLKNDNRVAGGKIVFGLSGYGDFHYNDLYHCSEEIKDRLTSVGLRTRFVLPQEGTVLSSVVVKKQKVLEIIMVKEDGKIVLGKTLTVQDFEEWGKRDFGRPAPDPHRGMLPPKVARMMVNLQTKTIQDRASAVTILDRNYVILDPFCGVGTILAEGMMLGLNVIGSDQSKEAIEKTRKNLEWLKLNYQLPVTNYQLLCCDATHISERLPYGSIEAIVTEPYLGPAMESQNRFWTSQNDGINNLNNIILGLEKLYLGCFREWHKILKPGGRVVIALPSFKIGGKEHFVKKPIDTCENLGYTLLSGPYHYSRPQAMVIRNIYILEKQRR